MHELRLKKLLLTSPNSNSYQLFLCFTTSSFNQVLYSLALIICDYIFFLVYAI